MSFNPFKEIGKGLSSIGSIFEGGFDIIKGGTDAVMGFFETPEVPKPPGYKTPWETYDEQRRGLAKSRGEDYASARARMGASGVAPGSSGWDATLSSVLESYDKKLDELGADPYFTDVRDKPGFGGWGEPPAGAPDWYSR